MKNNPSKAVIDLLSLLTPGEPVEILDAKNVVQWKGTVQETAPELGFAWIHNDMGERKLVDFQEHSLRRFQPPPKFGCLPLS